MRIALLAHSTNPRGGVVHALEVADALTDLGHEAVVHAPDVSGRGFFRPTRCATVSVPAEPVKGDLAELVERRIAEYVAHFSEPDARVFDVYHAQDPISANALATLAGAGVVPGFVRTVHHTDVFADPRLTAWQDRAILAADHVLCVSRLWRSTLAREYGVAATLVPSGVDDRRYTPERDATDDALAARLGLGGGPVFLSVGGVEARKNTVRVLAAFRAVADAVPSAQLVIAGGASLLDHSAYRRMFDDALRASGLEAGAGKSVVLAGPLPHSLMPALYRSAAALVFASVKEGFGLVVLEAMASGTPAVVSRVAPFTEHLAESECLWVDPLDPASIARGMTDALAPVAAWLAPAAPPPAGSAGPRPPARTSMSTRGGPRRKGRRPMPETRFRVLWPDGTRETCYSPSLVVEEFLTAGAGYPLAEFVERCRTALGVASERVRAKYGRPCPSALRQIARVEEAARRHAARPDARVVVEAFERHEPPAHGLGAGQPNEGSIP